MRRKSKKKNKKSKKGGKPAAPKPLFMQNNVPMMFYLPMGKDRTRIRELIEAHGGYVRKQHTLDAITLVSAERAASAARAGTVYLCSYVDDSVAAGKLLPLQDYRVMPPQSTARTMRTARKRRAKYTPIEDGLLLLYARTCTDKPRGRKAWVDAARMDLLEGRTQESMRSRYVLLSEKSPAIQDRLLQGVDRAMLDDILRGGGASKTQPLDGLANTAPEASAAAATAPATANTSTAAGDADAEVEEIEHSGAGDGDDDPDATQPGATLAPLEFVVDYPTPKSQLAVVDTQGHQVTAMDIDPDDEGVDSDDAMTIRMLQSLTGKRKRDDDDDDDDDDEEEESEGEGEGEGAKKGNPHKRQKVSETRSLPKSRKGKSKKKSKKTKSSEKSKKTKSSKKQQRKQQKQKKQQQQTTASATEAAEDPVQARIRRMRTKVHSLAQEYGLPPSMVVPALVEFSTMEEVHQALQYLKDQAEAKGKGKKGKGKSRKGKDKKGKGKSKRR